jgi:hypothetical protein
MTSSTNKQPSPFEIFRAREAADHDENHTMYAGESTKVEQAGMAALAEAGLLEGSHLRLLYSRPGLSLTYVWFKSGYALPLHSHNADCLYFIVGGSLAIGSEELGPGDGFFLASDIPYAYVPGENGVEVLEFRTSDHFDFQPRAKNADYWERMAAKMRAARTEWLTQGKAPSGLVVGRAAPDEVPAT